MADEDEVVRVARSLARHPLEEWPRLTDTDRKAVHERLGELSEQRAGRVAAHRQRLVGGARRLARDVSEYRVTIADAEARLEVLALTHNPETPEVPVALIDYRHACEIVNEAFAAAWKEAK
jgi:acyl-CoA reductase-like NAD-dependent aldehyde dehydrogenase